MDRTRARLGMAGVVLGAAAAVALAGCAPPLQNGETVVLPGAAERLAVLCRWRRGDAAQGDLCPAADADDAAAVGEASGPIPPGGSPPR